MVLMPIGWLRRGNATKTGASPWGKVLRSRKTGTSSQLAE